MAGFNGAGVFVRTYDWTDDKAAGIKVRADRMDTEMDLIATGLSTCITRDGQSTLTANIPFNSRKITGLAAGTGAGDSVRYEQVVHLSIAANQTITRTAAGTVLTLESTDAGATSGPDLVLYRNSASPAASDIGGSILWDFEEATSGDQTTVASISPTLTDATNNSMDAILNFAVITGGTLANEVSLTGANFYPTTNDGNALGISGTAWSDLFLASGAVVNWNAGDITLTHASAALTLANAASGTMLTLQGSEDGATSGPNVELYRISASPANSDVLSAILFYGRDSGAAKQLYGYIFGSIKTVTAGAEDGTLNFQTTNAGVDTLIATMDVRGLRSAIAILPTANDGAALGASGTAFSDLFLASAGVINWNAGNYTIIHSAGLLTTNGALTIVGALKQSADDGGALGASGTGWSDLFLASGGVINFNAGNYTITHAAGTISLSGTLDLGHATDTTIARASAGVISIEGVSLLTSGNCSFLAHKNGSAQGSMGTTPTKVTFSTETYDIGSAFATSTWTPLAGKISIAAGVGTTGTMTAGAFIIVAIYKNGSIFRFNYGPTTSATIAAANVSAHDVANGSDTYEVYCWSDADASFSLDGTSTSTWFSGTMI